MVMIQRISAQIGQAPAEPSRSHRLSLSPSREPAFQRQCACGGKPFGPAFLISYSLKQDTIKSDKKNFDVTTVDMNVAANP
jgi:hypothetical protein